MPHKSLQNKWLGFTTVEDGLGIDPIWLAPVIVDVVDMVDVVDDRS